jgi:hypothetical protein
MDVTPKAYRHVAFDPSVVRVVESISHTNR